MQVLLDTKKEYIEHLLDTFSTPLAKKIYKIYNEVNMNISQFQKELVNIKSWNNNKIKDEYNELVKKTNCKYLDKLLEKIVIIDIKLKIDLTNVKISRNELDIIKPYDFIHKCLINISIYCWKNVYLFATKNLKPSEKQYHLNVIEKNIRKIIKNTIRDIIPFEKILELSEIKSQPDPEPPSIIPKVKSQKPATPVITKQEEEYEEEEDDDEYEEEDEEDDDECEEEDEDDDDCEEEDEDDDDDDECEEEDEDEDDDDECEEEENEEKPLLEQPNIESVIEEPPVALAIESVVEPVIEQVVESNEPTIEQVVESNEPTIEQVVESNEPTIEPKEENKEKQTIEPTIEAKEKETEKIVNNLLMNSDDEDNDFIDPTNFKGISKKNKMSSMISDDETTSSDDDSDDSDKIIDENIKRINISVSKKDKGKLK
jgi:hypothetical protein